MYEEKLTENFGYEKYNLLSVVCYKVKNIQRLCLRAIQCQFIYGY